MIHGGIEGFDGRVNGNLYGDENGDPKNNSQKGERCPHLIETEVGKGDGFEEMKKDHKWKSLPTGRQANVKVQMSDECQSCSMSKLF